MTAVRTGMAAAARCLALDQLTAESITALERAGIVVVLLKGAGLAQRLYPDNPGVRRYCDVDLLVAPPTFERAGQVLAKMGLIDRSIGLREDEMSWYERSWRLSGPAPLAIDLHRGFFGVQDPTTFWEVISTSTETLDLCGVTIRVPDAAGCALIVGLHAAAPGPGSKPLTDLTQAFALLPDSVWHHAVRLARETRSTNAFARGLNRHSAGEALVVLMQLTAAGTLSDQLLARQSGWAAVQFAKLLDLGGPRAKVRYVARRLFASPGLMRLRHPIALHGKVGLAVAYMLRVRRAALHAPGAVRLVRREKRTLKPPPQPRYQTGLRAVRAAVKMDGSDRRTCVWTLRTLRQTGQQLAATPLANLDLKAPPAASPAGARIVERVLAHRGASCMETALVMQRWLAGQGIARDILIGVTAPGGGFRAHAWLDNSDGRDETELTEIHRRPPPPDWLTTRRPSSRMQRPSPG